MRGLPIALSVLAVTAGLTTGVTTASPSLQAAPNALCSLNLGSVTAGGDQVVQRIDAALEPTVGPKTVTPNVYADGAARLSSHWLSEETASGADRTGSVVLGNGLFAHSYGVTSSGAVDPAAPAHLTRIGGGWDRFTYFESSAFWYTPTAVRDEKYGLRDDGALFRWDVGESGEWENTGSSAAFGAVKAMALISKTSTYDTFLATTKSGALTTIRIPLTKPFRPATTTIRAATWQGFETLVTGPCLDDSTLIIGIDNDTKTGYAYVMSHAAGTSTTILGLGKIPLTFADQVYFRWSSNRRNDPMFGA